MSFSDHDESLRMVEISDDFIIFRKRTSLKNFRKLTLTWTSDWILFRRAWRHRFNAHQTSHFSQWNIPRGHPINILIMYNMVLSVCTEQALNVDTGIFSAYSQNIVVRISNINETHAIYACEILRTCLASICAV